jgi:hypothetical protein
VEPETVTVGFGLTVRGTKAVSEQPESRLDIITVYVVVMGGEAKTIALEPVTAGDQA